MAGNMPGSVRPGDRYELRDHPSLGGLVVVWWCPQDGTPQRTNITLGGDRVPLLAAALADWELAHHRPVPRPRPGLRAVTEDGAV
jgi:hypothetical protein